MRWFKRNAIPFILGVISGWFANANQDKIKGIFNKK